MKSSKSVYWKCYSNRSIEVLIFLITEKGKSAFLISNPQQIHLPPRKPRPYPKKYFSSSTSLFSISGFAFNIWYCVSYQIYPPSSSVQGHKEGFRCTPWHYKTHENGGSSGVLYHYHPRSQDCWAERRQKGQFLSKESLGIMKKLIFENDRRTWNRKIIP